MTLGPGYRSPVAKKLSAEDRRRWSEDGWCILDSVFDGPALLGAQDAVAALFPSAEQMAGGLDAAERQRWADWDAKWPEFPFGQPALNDLVVSEQMIGLAQELLGQRHVRLYMAIVSAKYASQPSGFNQLLHADFPNQTLVMPTLDPSYGQLEAFVYLSDVTRANGATRFVSRTRTAGVPAEQHTLGYAEYPELYDDDGDASAPAGSVVAYRPDVYHRSVDFSDPTGSRFMLHVGFRPADAEWGGYQAWQFRGFSPDWHDFVKRAGPSQLVVLGFPEPGHPYWTEATLASVGRRYPGLDLEPWRSTLSSRP